MTLGSSSFVTLATLGYGDIAPRGDVPGELLFRVTTGHVTLLRAKRPADAPRAFRLLTGECFASAFMFFSAELFMRHVVPRFKLISSLTQPESHAEGVQISANEESTGKILPFDLAQPKVFPFLLLQVVFRTQITVHRMKKINWDRLPTRITNSISLAIRARGVNIQVMTGSQFFMRALFSDRRPTS